MPLVVKPQTPDEGKTPAKPRFTRTRHSKKPPLPRLDHCLNCGEPATGRFCTHCGQENKDHTVALKPLLHDFLVEVVSWDSKLVQTLLLLVFRPGFLTNEYNAGRRVPYLSPLKLYLTVSVLFFLLLTWRNPVSLHAHLGLQIGLPGRGVHPSPERIGIGERSEPLSRSLADYEAYQKHLKSTDRDKPLERLFMRHAIRAGQNAQTFLNALLGDIPKMMFFLLPVFAVSLKMLYLRSHRLYGEHLIFLLHVHAFAFLLLTPLLLVHPDWLILSLCLVLCVYVAAALRAVYKQSWVKTLVKLPLLGIGYIFLLSLCIAGTTLVALWLL